MEKYFNILDKITEEKIDITKLYILSCCNSFTDDIAWMQMEYTYKCWLEADTDLDLARLTAIVCDNWEGIHCGAIQTQEIIEMCLS